jgi:hypothetical protein
MDALRELPASGDVLARDRSPWLVGRLGFGGELRQAIAQGVDYPDAK